MAETHKSLLEIKKQQWARERVEDMKNYGGIWGNFSDACEPRFRPCIRGTYRSTTDLKNYLEKTPPPVRKRTPSLPPIPSSNYEADSVHESLKLLRWLTALRHSQSLDNLAQVNMGNWAYLILTFLSSIVGITSEETKASLLGDLIPETATEGGSTCPKYFVEIIRRHRVACGGAIVTDSIVITSCECLGRQFKMRTIREKPSAISVKLNGVVEAVQVRSIVLHPLCDTLLDMTSSGTAIAKIDKRFKFGEEVTPLPLFTSNGNSLISHFLSFFDMEEVSCEVVALSRSVASLNYEPKCLFQKVNTLEITVTFMKSEVCEQLCNDTGASSCEKDLVKNDLFCARVSSSDVKSCDFVPGFPIVCEKSIWGIVPFMDECISNLIFFYGIRSVAEMYNMAFKFSVSSSCGDTKLEKIDLVPPEMISRRASYALNFPHSDQLVIFLVVINLSFYAIYSN